MTPHRSVPTRLAHAAWTALTVAAVMASPVSAQTDPEPRLTQLRERFDTPELRIGALLQHVADFQIDRTMPGTDGFSVANFRISLGGELDGGFSYFLQTSFVGNPAMLDATMSYRLSPTAAVDLGLFKSSFSGEFLVAAASIDFVNRSRAATAFAPGRQIGAQLRLHRADGSAGVTVGMFNGNRVATNANDSDDFLYVVRGHASRPLAIGGAQGRGQLGLNLATSRDVNATVGGGFLTGFSGRRTVVGGDARVEFDRLMLATEIDGAVLTPNVGARRTPWGAHVTAGWMLEPTIQILARTDFFDADVGTGRSEWFVVGINVWPTQATEFQGNYVIDLRDAAFDRHQVLLNFQIGF